MDNLQTNDNGLVSVIMPAFNAEKTILKALNSIIFQSYKKWECIVVDDGSTDNTFNIVQNINDKRVKSIRLKKNMGRGFARQVALENCNGLYLAMLDADDWIHPLKLERQVQAFFDNSHVDLVSCGIGVIDKRGDLFGVRAKGDGTVNVFNKPGKVPVAHASSMLRMKFAKKLSYDINLLLAQDVDFLRRYLLGKKYLILDCAYYYYTEHQSSSLHKITSAYIYNIKGLTKYFLKYPVLITINIIDQLLKIVIYNICGLFNQFEFMLRYRTVSPSANDLSDFERCNKAFSMSSLLK